ncbi:MAG TPA: FAD-binding oxidoreductase [Rhizomicrobium sp.]|nr:FAD-binding oxidoreductase [Rhizomicrobium sp.]
MERDWIRWNGWGDQGHDEALAMNEHAWRWLAQSFAMPALLATPARTGAALPPPRLAGRDQFIALLGAAGVQQDDASRMRHAAGKDLADLLRLRGGDFSTAPDAVLTPRHEEDVLAALKLCADLGVAVVPFGGGTGDVTPVRGAHSSIIALDMSGLNRVTSLDTMSGLAEVEAGITGPELERQLAAHGMTLGHRPGDFENSTLGGWIAEGGDACEWLRGLRVATPQGLLVSETRAPDLSHLMRGSRGAFGVITRATIRIQAQPETDEYRGYLFPDFAAGLAAMREVQRRGLPHVLMQLSDDGETRFCRAMQRTGWNLREHMFDVYLAVRRFDGSAARLLAGFSGRESEVRAARKAFDRLAKKLGAIALGVDNNWRRRRFASRRDSLLDRGTGMDRLEISASWSQLPLLYVTVRAALKQAMRVQVPRAGAHGLVLVQVGSARADGATLTFTWAFPRKLEDEIAQAQAIRHAALTAIGGREGAELERGLQRAIKQALDPEGILNPGKLV